MCTFKRIHCPGPCGSYQSPPYNLWIRNEQPESKCEDPTATNHLTSYEFLKGDQLCDFCAGRKRERIAEASTDTKDTKTPKNEAEGAAKEFVFIRETPWKGAGKDKGKKAVGKEAAETGEDGE